MEPHKGLLMSLFFVAVGMSVDVAALAQRPFSSPCMSWRSSASRWRCSMSSASSSALAAARRCGWRSCFPRVASSAFVVFGAAKALGVIDDLVFVMAVAVISLTMLLTPVLVKLGNWLATRRTEEAPTGIHERFRYSAHGDESEARVVIGGYGRVGHTVGTILASSGIPYVAFETDAVLVAKWRSEGHPVFYGDIGDPELLATRRAATGRPGRPDDRRPGGRRSRRGADPLARAAGDHRRPRPRPGQLRRPAAGGRQQAFPETLEASLRLAAETLEALGISTTKPTCCCAACAAQTTHWYATDRRVHPQAPPRTDRRALRGHRAGGREPGLDLRREHVVGSQRADRREARNGSQKRANIRCSPASTPPVTCCTPSRSVMSNPSSARRAKPNR
jgi:glutathione-regulated potassium-efflux system ancillary protein KefC